MNEQKDTAQEYKADAQVIEQYEKVIRDNGLSFKESTELFRLARFAVFNEGEPICRRPILTGRNQFQSVTKSNFAVAMELYQLIEDKSMAQIFEIGEYLKIIAFNKKGLGY
jgi:hypothetical protein